MAVGQLTLMLLPDMPGHYLRYVVPLRRYDVAARAPLRLASYVQEEGGLAPSALTAKRRE